MPFCEEEKTRLGETNDGAAPLWRASTDLQVLEPAVQVHRRLDEESALFGER